MTWVAKIREWDLGAANDVEIVELRAEHAEEAVVEAKQRHKPQHGRSVEAVGKVTWIDGFTPR